MLTGQKHGISKMHGIAGPVGVGQYTVVQGRARSISHSLGIIAEGRRLLCCMLLKQSFRALSKPDCGAVLLYQ